MIQNTFTSATHSEMQSEANGEVFFSVFKQKIEKSKKICYSKEMRNFEQKILQSFSSKISLLKQTETVKSQSGRSLLNDDFSVQMNGATSPCNPMLLKQRQYVRLTAT